MITVLNTNDSGAGSLRQAIADASPGEVIDFDAGALPVIELTSAELLIDKDLTITGPGSGSLTVRRTAGSFRIFHINDASPLAVTINGLTIDNGEELAGQGGGLYAQNCTLTMEDAIFTSGQAVNGGGIAIDSGATATLTLVSFGTNNADINGGGAFVDGVGNFNNCTFANNTVVNSDATGSFGGGLANIGGAYCVGCTFQGNSSETGVAGGEARGGALHNDGTMGLTNCLIAENVATGADGPSNAFGGGISNGFGTASLSNCIIRDNEAIAGSGAGATGANAYGGGIQNEFGTVYGGEDEITPDALIGSTIEDNSASGGTGSTDGGVALGGGIQVNFGTTALGRCTISGNIAAGGPGTVTGGAALGGGCENEFGSLYVRSSTVSGNSANGGNGGVTNGVNYGGGIANTTASALLNNSTITNNATIDNTGGGGLALYPDGLAESTNSIIGGNTATDDIYIEVGTPELISHGHNALGSIGGGGIYTPGTGDMTGVTSFTLDLGALQDNGGPTYTHALGVSSIALDAGDPTPDPLSPTDQRGEPRVVNGTQDIGSYETQSAVATANWSQMVTTPYTGYVYVVDLASGSTVPTYRYYSGVTTTQTNQDFVLYGAILECQIPEGTQDFAPPGVISPVQLAMDTDRAELWVTDSQGSNLAYVDAEAGTALGYINAGTNIIDKGLNVFYDTNNQQVVAYMGDFGGVSRSAQIVFIDAETKVVTSRVAGTGFIADRGYHCSAFDPISSLVYVCDNRGAGTNNNIWVIDCTIKDVVRKDSLGLLSVDAICWCPNIERVYISHLGVGAPLYHLYDPVTGSISASTIISDGANFHYECAYVPTTGHVLQTYNGGGTGAKIIDVVLDAFVGSLGYTTSRIWTCAENTCTSHLYVSSESGGIMEYDLNNPITPYTLINQFGGAFNDTATPDGLAHSRISNLMYFTDYTVDAVRSLISTGTAVIPYILNYEDDVLPNLIDPASPPSPKSAWTGTFDQFVAGVSVSPVFYYFIDHSIIGLACGGDDTAGYPWANWPDTYSFTNLHLDTDTGFMVLEIVTSENDNLWTGTCAQASAYAPSGAYSYASGASGSISTIIVVTGETANQVVTPNYSPDGGLFLTSTLVTITCATPGATIYYTTDDTTPTISSPLYSVPITISGSVTPLRAFAVNGGMTDSNVALSIYTPTTQVATPEFTPNGDETFVASVEVTITCATVGASIFYTTDGSDPTEFSLPYFAPVTLTETTTLKAMATNPGEIDSAIFSAVFTEAVNLVLNPGFETGDFDSWTVVDPSDSTFALGAPYNHTGDFGAFLGAYDGGGGNGTLSQVISTGAGNYSLSFWLKVDDTPELFDVYWESGSVAFLGSEPIGPYTQFSYSVVATGPTSLLEFRYLSPSGFTYAIDDVGVTPI